MADLPGAINGSHGSIPVAGDGQSRILPISELERQTILTTIDQLNGDKLMAARLLGIGKTTLYSKLKEYSSLDQA